MRRLLVKGEREREKEAKVEGGKREAKGGKREAKGRQKGGKKKVTH